MLLLVGFLTQLAALLVANLLCVFVVAVSINLLRGRKIDCGCGGGRFRAITWRHVGTNALLLPAAILVFVRQDAVLVFDSVLKDGPAPQLSNSNALAILAIVSVIPLSYVVWAEVRNLGRAGQGFQPARKPRRAG
jgi:hypothetical protein